jgi:hypothetical protein
MQRGRFSGEFKAQAIKLVRDRGKQTNAKRTCRIALVVPSFGASIARWSTTPSPKIRLGSVRASVFHQLGWEVS